jgi:hypothetical protein
MPAARATLDMLAGLDVRTVIPGHGAPFLGTGAALERAYARLDALEADDTRVARHVLKALLTFTLLERRRMPVADLPAYVDRIPIYRDLNEAILHLSPADLAALLVRELARAGAVRQDGGDLVPA